MLYEIGDVLLPILFVFLLAFLIYILVKIRVSKWGKTNLNEEEKGTKARAKILFKSVDEFDRTNYSYLTTRHVTNYYIDCLINGEKKTFLCSEYMYDYVQKGETYDVIYTSHMIELDRKYYPDDDFDDDFDDYDSE